MADPWFRCQVDGTGPAEDATIYVRLRDVHGAFPARWFKANVQIKREVLATSLAAVTTGFHVDTLLTSSNEYSFIQRMYLVRPG
jgi:hypothetical protein